MRGIFDLHSVPDLFQLVQIGQTSHYKQNRIIFAQGEVTESLFLLTQGRVRITAISRAGKQATVAIIHPGIFFGVACLTNDTKRKSTARALTDCTVIRIPATQMRAALRDQRHISEMFINFLLRQQRQYEDDLIDRRLNCSEHRLARALVALAYADRNPHNERQITAVNQEILAELIGTTRARVNWFMHRLRERGYIAYGRKSISVRPSIFELFKR